MLLAALTSVLFVSHCYCNISSTKIGQKITQVCIDTKYFGVDEPVFVWFVLFRTTFADKFEPVLIACDKSQLIVLAPPLVSHI